MNRDEHLLTCLAEECAEVAQRISKALRFGLSEVQDGQPLTNAERITEELRDLLAVMNILEGQRLIAPVFITHDVVAAKHAKIKRYFEISRAQGTLQEAR